MRALTAMARSERKSLLNHRQCRTCQSGRMCKEVERELSRLTVSLRESPHAGIENKSQSIEPEDREIQSAVLAAKLKCYALPDIYVDVIIRVCVNNWSFADIASDLNIVSRQQARWIYNRGIALLKERGFT